MVVPVRSLDTITIDTKATEQTRNTRDESSSEDAELPAHENVEGEEDEEQQGEEEEQQDQSESDGDHSQDEVAAENSFDRMDTNGDGYVDFQEFAAAMHARRVPRSNHNGVHTRVFRV
jgi:cobalamin biosynthesis protein CobT